MTKQRQKAFLRQAKPKQKKEQKLETADEYLAAGVDHEEAAGKWRGGDAAKSMRFFQRAIEVYEQGLQKFPENVDLAYNKARVQSEIAIHPVLAPQLQIPLSEALQAAIESHRYALKLDPENADLLFNTAQVLTTIAEEGANSESLDESEALQYVEDALNLLAQCLRVQEVKYQENVEQTRLAMQQIEAQGGEQAAIPMDEDDENEDEEGEEDADNASEMEDDRWASIVEPVDQDTLIDTTLAQLATLTTFCGILSNLEDSTPPQALAWAEKYSTDVLDKLPAFLQEKPDRQQEGALARANLVSSMLEAGFRAGRVDAATYKSKRDEAFSVSELQPSFGQPEDPAEIPITNARSLISFNSALFDAAAAAGSPQPELSELRWSALTTAVTNLTSASKIKGVSAEGLVATHLLRGDASMCLQTLAFPPASYQPATNQADQFRKNAEVYYRNASKLSTDPEEKAVAAFRSAVVAYVRQVIETQGDPNTLLAAAKPQGPDWVRQQVDEMFAEGLLPEGIPM